MENKGPKVKIRRKNNIVPPKVLSRDDIDLTDHTPLDNESSYPSEMFEDLVFIEGLAAVKLKDGWTFVDKDHNIWPERFKNNYHFSEGLAAVELEDGLTFVDKDHNIWPERFKSVNDFSEGLAKVELKDGQTFIDKDHNIWPERFSYIDDFYGGLAIVELKDGWTFMDKNHNIWPERFESVEYFSGGLAKVELKDGWTFMDKEHNIWPDRFEKAGHFNKGLAAVQLKGNLVFVDKERRIYSRADAAKLENVYNKPETFLVLPSERFEDENFMQGAILQVKNSLIDSVKKQETVDEKYKAYCLDLLTKCKEKVQKENEILKIKSEKKELIKTIKDFNL